MNKRNTSGRHNMSQWVKITDLRFKTHSKSVIFSDGSYHVRGSYYVYHWNTNWWKRTNNFQCRTVETGLQYFISKIWIRMRRRAEHTEIKTLDHGFQNLCPVNHSNLQCIILLLVDLGPWIPGQIHYNLQCIILLSMVTSGRPTTLRTF